MMQIITEPTRDKHILDLFFINCPNHVMNVSTLPGLSNRHDLVAIKTNIKSSIHKQTKRSILLCKKADGNTIGAGLHLLMDEMCINNTNLGHLEI